MCWLKKQPNMIQIQSPT